MSKSEQGLHAMESKPIDELIQLAIAEEERRGEDSTDLRPLQALHARGSLEVLDAATALCCSASPTHRRLGTGILGELGSPTRTFPEECCDILLERVQHDADASVVSAAIFALGHLANRRCETYLIPLHKSPDPTIRHAIAFALCGSTVPASIEVLLELMDHPYHRVRDWATTGIGQTVSLDGPDIRDALLRRVTDPDEITRAEAFHGLARREDKRAIPFLIGELQRKNEHSYLFVDAASTFLGLNDSHETSPEELSELLQSRYQHP